MGYVFDFYDAKSFHEGFNTPYRRFATEMEHRLIRDLLQPLRGKTVLDVGCGTGAGLLYFIDIGLQASGLDASPYMLDIARENVKTHVDLHRGVAEELPFDDNAFNYACLSTTLEFVDDPQKAIAEACRVASDKVFLGVLNRYAVKSIQRRVKGVFMESIYNRARFFSIWELKQMVRTLLGDVPITWRTVCQLPAAPGWITTHIERSHLMQRCPFGAFAGMAVTLLPRFRTTPLALTYTAKHSGNPVAG